MLDEFSSNVDERVIIVIVFVIVLVVTLGHEIQFHVAGELLCREP